MTVPAAVSTFFSTSGLIGIMRSRGFSPSAAGGACTMRMGVAPVWSTSLTRPSDSPASVETARPTSWNR